MKHIYATIVLGMMLHLLLTKVVKRRTFHLTEEGQQLT
jgi:hypothetical protein